MSKVTTLLPDVQTEGFFSFKEPFASYLNKLFNTNIETTLLKIDSISSIRDLVVNNNIDPYTAIYLPAGISEIQYRADAINEVKIITFTYQAGTDIRLFRVPHSYLAKIVLSGTVLYKNKLFVIDLGQLPATLNFQNRHIDIENFISSITGVSALIKEVDVGEGSFISEQEHRTKETIRTNSIIFKETYKLLYEKLLVSYNRLKQTYDNLLKKYHL